MCIYPGQALLGFISSLLLIPCQVYAPYNATDINSGCQNTAEAVPVYTAAGHAQSRGCKCDYLILSVKKVWEGLSYKESSPSPERGDITLKYTRC